ncbi:MULTISPECIES: TetR/AcrR family transcriptional regulator [unclassified Variovorax]|uniref:TetR/AcrR family transcriptional regulator n=1 Tax=unclassified Variovorax TaxID=663243 RepID=UPI001BD2DEDF|nr:MULTISPECIES: TetR/AcrR family transcriptional regulator [unclassified Variovorax]
MKSRSQPLASPKRRKPLQSRSKETSRALQEAFVQLLVERDYARVTIREIVALAGTGLGSFYQYFASKDELARTCIHLRTKALLQAMRDAVNAHAGQPLPDIVDAVLESQLAAVRKRPQEWGVHFVLERHLSGPEAYRKMYQQFIDEWVHAFEVGAGLPAGFPSQEAALVSQAIMYELFATTHIRSDKKADLEALERQARTALHAYLAHVPAQGESRKT